MPLPQKRRLANQNWDLAAQCPCQLAIQASLLAGALHGGAEGSGAFPGGWAVPRERAFVVGGGSWVVRSASGQDGCREDEKTKKQRSHFELFGK